MKAYLIDPHTRTVSVADYNGDYRQIYALLSAEGFRVSAFDIVRLGRFGSVDVCCYVDDEGLLVADNPTFGFVGTSQVLAGRGLILGGDDEGETVGAPDALTIEAVRAAVSWNSLTTSGDVTPLTRMTPPPGYDWALGGSEPILRMKWPQGEA